MAFFKFRKSGDEQSTTSAKPESIETMRRRAKHRLIGATVLVLIGVIGLPMLFDKQPRPISVDTPIEIPDKNKAKPLNIPAPAAIDVAKPEAAAPVVPPVPVTETAAAPKIEEKVPVAPVKPALAAPKVVADPVVKVDEGKKAQALLDGKVPEKKADASEGRFVVQVGAFADATRAREVRLKLEHAGLKTYTQVAGPKDAQKIRVRVGPFAGKAEADKAAEKIKKLALPAAVLTL